MSASQLRILKARDVAARLGWSLRTTREHLASGKLPGRKQGREWLISEGALERHLSGATSGEERAPLVHGREGA